MVHNFWMVSALESETCNAGHLDTSKIVDYRDIQNISEELSHSQGDPRVCENRPLISTTATESVTGPSIAQSTSEERLISKATSQSAKAFLLLLPLLWRLFDGLLLSKTHLNSCLIPKLKTLNAETVQLLLQILRRLLRDLHVSKTSLKNCPSPKVTTWNAETVSVFLPPLQRQL
ncbi:hypothetical protein AVEN_154606-1 [Araneus ventricosus]|uniref:Uncharacterized protein n=1 Tax=Araneus ventricosus TaxID=182803 RepID=A0A4Y2JVW8_ARAVE|nr:hypothetical protein AVEN_154606-1 [Araneus ventricosus]